MKTTFIVSILINVVLSVILMLIFFLKQGEHLKLSKICQAHYSAQKEHQSLRDTISFFHTHQQTIKELHGWSPPASRLEAARCLELLKSFLTHISYTFEAEERRRIGGTQDTVQITKITLFCHANSDSQIYTFIESLLKEFPGVLIPRELTLMRSREETASPALIKASLICEWVYTRMEGRAL